MKNIFCFFALIIFASCGNDKTTVNENSTATDTLAVGNSQTLFAFNENEFKVLNLPLNIDTLFIQKIDSNSRITYQQVRQLGVNFLKGKLGDGLVYDINEFAQIDSLKQSGGYKAYLEKLDIGMTKTCIAYKVGVVKLNDGNKIFIWGITNQSYEACPFFSGTLLVATFVNANNEATSFDLAEISGGGDPPSMMDTETTAKITGDGKVEIISTITSDDMDVPGEGIEKTTFKLEVNANAIVLKDVKEEILSKEDELKQDH